MSITDRTVATTDNMELITSSNITLASPTEVEQVSQDPGWLAIHVALMAIILAFALLGNTSLCWIILTDHKLRSVPNKLVLNLAVCGLFTVVANGPLILLILAGDARYGWQYGVAACQFNGFTTSVYGLASVMTLAVISVNRYQMIRRSTGRFASWFTRSTIRFLIAGVWLLSAVLAFPPVVGWSRYDYIPERAICTLKWSTEISYTIFVFTTGIFLPFVVMFAAYFAIFRLVRNKFKRMREHNARSNPQASCSRNASNSSIGRYLNSTDRRPSVISRRGSQHTTGPSGGDSVVAGAVRPVSGEPNSARRASFKATVVGNAALTEPTTSVHLHPGVRSINRGRSWSLVEEDIKDDSKYLQVLNNASTCDSENKHRSLTLAVPISYQRDPSLWSTKMGDLPARPKSAHCRIYRTSSAPEHGDDILKRQRSNTKTSRGGRATNVKLSAGGAFLPPKDDLRVTVMVFMVLASFVLCWSPVTVINFLESAWELDVSPALNIFSVYMIFASSAINPLIYGMMNRNFRSGFKRFFCSFWTHCGACKCCMTQKLPRQNRVSVIDLHDDAQQ